MSEEFMTNLDRSLVTAYRLILKIEDEFIKRSGAKNVSSSEMHLLEAIWRGGQQGKTAKELATELGITQPSVTVAVNKLEKKGCVERIKSTLDGRVVYIHLTELGRDAYTIFAKFHEDMIRAVTQSLSPDEMGHLLTGMVKLNDFFDKFAPAEED